MFEFEPFFESEQILNLKKLPISKNISTNVCITKVSDYPRFAAVFSTRGGGVLGRLLCGARPLCLIFQGENPRFDLRWFLGNGESIVISLFQIKGLSGDWTFCMVKT